MTDRLSLSSIDIFEVYIKHIEVTSELYALDVSSFEI